MSKAVVLLSGGQDSTTSLYWAMQNFDEVLAVSIFYGQRHAVELQAARSIAAHAGVEHAELELGVLAALSDSALVDPTKALTASGGRQDVAMPNGLPSSFVPGRNMLFLTVAASFAVKHGVRDIVTGVCQTDFSGYPDCRRSFIDALEPALNAAMPSSAGPLRVITPLMWLTKAETVRMAKRLPGCWEALAMSVTCYNGERPGCGKCPACKLRAAGFHEAGWVDPAQVQAP
jgi:7-cyano-7-deazaguanine synthase